MADPITIIALAASIASLIEFGSRIVTRLQEFKTNAPSAFQDIADQLPLLLEIVQKLQARVPNDPLSQDTQRSLFRTIDGCTRQISEIHKLIGKWVPSPQDSSLKRVRKAFGSVNSEKKIMEALRILETYKTTLLMYSANSGGPTSYQLDIRNFYDLPSKQISHFVGRHGALEELTRCLEDNGRAKIHHRKIAVLIGMGGQGKTPIALEYCRRTQASRTFSFIFWIDVSSESSLVRSYGNIAEKLTRSRVTFPDDISRVSYVKEFFARSCDNWMLVFENFDRPDLFHNIKDYFPAGNSGACLFTSRHAQSGRLGTCIAVTKMTEDD